MVHAARQWSMLDAGDPFVALELGPVAHGHCAHDLAGVREENDRRSEMRGGRPERPGRGGRKEGLAAIRRRQLGGWWRTLR